MHFAAYNLFATLHTKLRPKPQLKKPLLEQENPKNILYCQSVNDFVHTRFTLAVALNFRDRIGGTGNFIIMGHTNLV